MRYRFGEYEVDVGRFVLLRRGSPVPIEPRPLSLLLHLLERHPDVVPRDELLDLLWPDTTVLEGSLTRAVREIRRALRERAEPEGGGVIRTIRGRGYGIGVEVECVGGETVRPSPPPAADAPARPPRQLLAILSADMADYAEHVAWSEAKTSLRLDALQAEVQRILAGHGGLLVHFVRDGLLAVFRSAESAGRAALALREHLRSEAAERPDAPPMAFRMGLHVADLIEDGGRVYGGGVRIAGHLERLAEPGGLCLSAAIHEQIADRLGLDCEDVGPIAMKGLDRPERVYRLRAG